MMRFIRWQGLATFFVIIIGIIIFFYMFAETLIKLGIEKGTSHYTGAEVNVASVELSYSPVTLAINGFQATDAQQPENNMVAFNQAVAGIDVWQYFLGKIIIDDLTVDGLQFSGKRAEKGQIFLEKESGDNTDKDGDSSVLPDIKANLPNAKDIVNNSDLLTVKASKALQATYTTEKENLANIQDDLPDKARLEEYKQQLKELSKTKVKSLDDLEALKSKYDQLKKQFKEDKASVKSAKTKLASAKTAIAEKLTALKEAPQQDWQHIEKKYQLENIDGADFAHILFGDKAREYYDVALTVYEKLSPLLTNSGTSEAVVEKEAATGRFVYFSEENPQPEFLIKHALFSLILPQGDFEIEVHEATHQHWVKNLPTTYKITSSNLLKQGRGAMTGQLQLTQEQNFSSHGQWLISDAVIENAQLRESDSLSLSLEQGNLSGQGSYTADQDNVDSQNSFTLSQGQYQGNANSSMGEMLIETISSVDELTVKLSATGSLTSPDWHISSPLDKALKNALGAQVSKKLAGFKADVQSGLNDKLTSALGMSSSDNADIVNIETLLSDSDNALDNLLDSDIIKEKEEELKNKAKDKVKDKLKEKLGKFF
jgi:uncharacterized protein (TIGR03545 family)